MNLDFRHRKELSKGGTDFRDCVNNKRIKLKAKKLKLEKAKAHLIKDHFRKHRSSGV